MEKRLSAVQWERKIFCIARKYVHDGVISAVVRKMQYRSGDIHVSYDASIGDAIVCYERSHVEAIEKLKEMCNNKLKTK